MDTFAYLLREGKVVDQPSYESDAHIGASAALHNAGQQAAGDRVVQGRRRLSTRFNHVADPIEEGACVDNQGGRYGKGGEEHPHQAQRRQ